MIEPLLYSETLVKAIMGAAVAHEGLVGLQEYAQNWYQQHADQCGIQDCPVCLVLGSTREAYRRLTVETATVSV